MPPSSRSSLSADGFLAVTDNGRGIPVDPHPKYKKPALEVIMTTLHSGGKFDSKVYETSGGLHGVGVSVVNALSDNLEVEVARGRQLYRQRFSRGIAARAGWSNSAKSTTGAAPRSASIPTAQIFGKGAAFEPARLYRMTRSKAYLFGGVEIRWTCDPSLIKEKDQTPAKATFHFPGGLKDYLAASLGDDFQVTREIFAGKSEKQGGHGAHRMGRHLVRRRRLRQLLLQHHSDRRRRHARGRLPQRADARACAPMPTSSATSAPRSSPRKT